MACTQAANSALLSFENETQGIHSIDTPLLWVYPSLGSLSIHKLRFLRQFWYEPNTTCCFKESKTFC